MLQVEGQANWSAPASAADPSANNDLDDTSSLLQCRPGSHQAAATASVVRRPVAAVRSVLAAVAEVAADSWMQQRGPGHVSCGSTSLALPKRGLGGEHLLPSQARKGPPSATVALLAASGTREQLSYASCSCDGSGMPGSRHDVRIAPRSRDGSSGGSYVHRPAGRIKRAAPGHPASASGPPRDDRGAE